jgi:hypothetical protein
VDTGLAHPFIEQTSFERRAKRLNCKRCGSSDVWRIKSKPGFVAFFLERGGKKRFSCRSCGRIFYALARRKEDENPVAAPIEQDGDAICQNVEKIDLVLD